MTDTRRWALAGFLSAEREYADRHPETLLPLADRILTYLNELAPDEANEAPFKIAVTHPGETWTQVEGRTIRMIPSAPDEVNEAET